MRLRYGIAAGVIVLVCLSVGLWRGLALQSASEPVLCDSVDPLSPCATAPQTGYPAHELLISEPELASAGVGDPALAAIRFAPGIADAQIAEFLAANKATMVGPKPGGMYTVRLPATGTAKDDLIKQMRAQSAIVDFIATVQ